MINLLFILFFINPIVADDICPAEPYSTLWFSQQECWLEGTTWADIGEAVTFIHDGNCELDVPCTWHVDATKLQDNLDEECLEEYGGIWWRIVQGGNAIDQGVGFFNDLIRVPCNESISIVFYVCDEPLVAFTFKCGQC